MFEQAFKNIDDVLHKDAGCASELDYTEQTSWLLFGVTPITRTVLHSVYKQFGGLIRGFFLLFNTPFKVNRGLLLDTLAKRIKRATRFLLMTSPMSRNSA